MTKIRFFRHNVTLNDILNVIKTLRSDFITTGPVTEEFERRFSEFLGVKYTVGLTSCTAALFLGLKALGIKEGDEVIVPALTFVSTASVVEHCKAKPVFCDVERDTGLIDLSEMKKKITKRTKAVIPVHIYGQMADIKNIVSICKEKKIAVIEDAAHGPDMERDGIRPGVITDLAAFSFYATKNITCGEGGALSTQKRSIYEKVKILRLHGLTHDAANRYQRNRFVQYDVIDAGYKYNMSDIQASLLIYQLQNIKNNTEKRREIYKRYCREIERIKGIFIPPIDKYGKSCYHLMTIQVDPGKREKFIETLNDNGVPVSVHFHPVHLFSYYKRKYGFKRGDFPNAEKIGFSTITLPFHPFIKEREFRKVISSLKKAAEILS